MRTLVDGIRYRDGWFLSARSLLARSVLFLPDKGVQVGGPWQTLGFHAIGQRIQDGLYLGVAVHGIEDFRPD